MTVMVVVKAVALSQAWKPIREFRRLPLSWKGYVSAKQAEDHPWKTSSWRFKVSQAQGNLLHSQTCSLSAKVLRVGGCTKPPTGIFLLWLNRMGLLWLELWISSHPVAVPRKTIKGFAERGLEAVGETSQVWGPCGGPAGPVSCPRHLLNPLPSSASTPS